MLKQLNQYGVHQSRIGPPQRSVDIIFGYTIRGTILDQTFPGGGVWVPIGFNDNTEVSIW